MDTEHPAAFRTIEMWMRVLILKFALALAYLVFRQPAAILYPVEQMMLQQKVKDAENT